MDEFGIDLDKVLDEFEEREEGNVYAPDGFQRGQLPRELTKTDGVIESRPLSSFPAFEGLDLDLAEADFAPSHWNYEISSEDNSRSDLKVVASTAEKETLPVPVPDVELLRSKSEMDHESAEALSATNQILRSKVDVLSACLHTCVAELDVPGMEEQLENRSHEDVATSPPDIVRSAPDVVSSAMVGVDVVPSSRTGGDALEKLNLNQESKNFLEQTVYSDCKVSTLESLDVILKQSSAESESTDELCDETLAQESEIKCLESRYVQDACQLPAAATEIPSHCEDEHKKLFTNLNGATSCGISDTAECFDTKNGDIEEITESSTTVSHPVTASCPEENENCNDIADNITSAFSPFPPLPTSCDTKGEASSEEAASKPQIAVLHKEVDEGSRLESSEVLDQQHDIAVCVDGNGILLTASDRESSRFEAQPKNEEICGAEIVNIDQAKTNSLEFLTDHSESFDSPAAQLETTVFQNSDSIELDSTRDANSEPGQAVCESEDLKGISEKQGVNEVIPESPVQHSISGRQSEREVMFNDPGSVQQTNVRKMSLEDEKQEQKIVTEEKIETEIFLVDKSKPKLRNMTESFGEEPSELGDEVAENTEELNKQSNDVLESGDLVKEMAKQDTTERPSCAETEIAERQTTFGGAESENDFTEEDIETYLTELDMNPDKEATCPEMRQNPDGDDDNSSFKEKLLPAENVKFAQKGVGPVDIEEETPSDLLYDAVVLENTSEFNAADKATVCSGELNQLDMLPSPSESFMLVNGNGAEVDVGFHSLDVPVQFGNLADEQVESLMKEVEEEVRQMILDAETATDRDGDQTYSNSSDSREADVAQSSIYANRKQEESFEDQAMFVVYGSEAKDGKLLKKVLNSEANQSHVTPTRPDLKDALPGDAVQSEAAVETGPEANACGLHPSSANDVAATDHSLLLPVIKRFDQHGETPSNVQSNEDDLLPADVPEPQQPESVSGARQKEMKAVKPQLLDLASSLQEPPATPFEAGNEVTVPSGLPSDIQSTTLPSLPPGILSSSAASTPTIPLCSNISLEITQLGKVAPVWLPDAEASKCMECEVPFSFTRRRHHCRACGKVFCHGCSNLRATLQYLENRQDRVCSKCYQDLVRASYYERNQPAVSMRLNPNDSGSTISSPVPAQASSEPQQLHQQYPPSVSTPTGVLRKQGSIKGEAKQVMFSDGIRPGGDLTDLDGSSDVRQSTRRSRKADKSSPAAAASSTAQIKNLPEAKRTSCLIPNSGLPPVVTISATKRDLTMKSDIPAETVLQRIRDEQDLPVTFAINRDVVVLVKIINLDCCVNRLCWCFTTKGLCTVGQDEIVIILECLPDEKTVPLDILQHLHVVYEMASHGNTVNNLDHTVLPSGSLGSNEVGGFLYIRQTFQCLQKIILPDAPFLFGLLLQKWEMSWARVFPLRLMFRLGAEFRYYPSPLISVRSRKPVYGEIGHTIMNLLADFHNYQYMIPRINGLVIHMEDKRTTVSIPRNRYNMLMKILSNSDDHVIALGASFSSAADSHLVCLQNEDGNYQTQAINIQNRPRRVTGACFIVFNGALKPTSGLRAKSSIVEDGLMVQITSDAMTELKQVLSEMRDYKILCGSIEVPQPDEMVIIEWNNDEKHINAGVKSPIDGLSMYGVDSIRIHSSTDFAKDELTIRWTEVFVLRNGASQGASSEASSEVSHLAESLAQACCQALVGHLSRLAFEMLTKIALRVTIDTEQVGYEIGSCGVRLPDFCMNDLDEKLIGIIHGAASQARSGPIILELIFHVLHPYIAQSAKTPAK